MAAFPFQYLGLPLDTCKLNRVHCQPLVEKVVAKLRGWKQRMLSMAGRYQLVKTTLLALGVYWNHAFELPVSS